LLAVDTNDLDLKRIRCVALCRLWNRIEFIYIS
jgi:hypothetical protein